MLLRLCAFMLASFTLLASAALAQQALDENGIRTRVVGKSMSWGNNGIAQYGTDGSYSFIHPDGATDHGNWIIEGSRLCVTYVAGTHICFLFFADEQGLIGRRGADNLLRLSEVSANSVAPSAQKTRVVLPSLSICEQTVQYKVVPPELDVPPDVRRFSGIWIGSWSNQLCAAVIVEQVAKDGTVTATHVFGSNPEWYVKHGKSQWPGKVVNGVLILQNNTDKGEFKFVNSNELDGKYAKGPRTRSVGQFKRQP